MSEEENKNAVQDGQSQEEAVNSEQTEVQAEAKPTAENKSFSDKVKAFTDSTKKKINALTKKQKQIGLAIIAAILIVIIGLSVGIPLGLRSAGVVNAAGWDKAIDATIAEFDKDNPNWSFKSTMKTTYLYKGVVEEESYIMELCADGNKYKYTVYSEDNEYIEIVYYAKENGKLYKYQYNEDLDQFKKIGNAQNSIGQLLSDLLLADKTQSLKGTYSAFKRKDGKYQAKDMEQLKEYLSALFGSDYTIGNVGFSISFKNEKIKELSCYEGNTYDRRDLTQSYIFGGVNITLPTNVIVA